MKVQLFFNSPKILPIKEGQRGIFYVQIQRGEQPSGTATLAE